MPCHDNVPSRTAYKTCKRALKSTQNHLRHITFNCLIFLFRIRRKIKQKTLFTIKHTIRGAAKRLVHHQGKPQWEKFVHTHPTTRRCHFQLSRVRFPSECTVLCDCHVCRVSLTIGMNSFLVYLPLTYHPCVTPSPKVHLIESQYTFTRLSQSR